MELSQEKTPWYHKPWVVILLIIFVLGPFGLPLVFKSRRFSPLWKAIVTVATIGYTAYLIFLTLQMTQAVVREWASLQTLLSPQ